MTEKDPNIAIKAYNLGKTEARLGSDDDGLDIPYGEQYIEDYLRGVRDALKLKDLLGSGQWVKMSGE